LTRMTPEYAAALLGLGPDASHEQVNRAWRVWAKLAHPDIGGDRGHFEALASARAVLLSAVDSPSERTTPPASSSAPRVALRSVTRRPRGAVLLALALATGAAFVLALSIPDLPEPTAALVVGSIAGSAAWVLGMLVSSCCRTDLDRGGQRHVRRGVPAVNRPALRGRRRAHQPGSRTVATESPANMSVKRDPVAR
jgi:hypothetical protein